MSDGRPSALIGIGQILLGSGLVIAGLSELRKAREAQLSGGDVVVKGRVVRTNGLGESLSDAMKRTRGALQTAKLMAAGPIERSIAQMRRLALRDAEKPEMKEIVSSILSRRCPTGSGKLELCVPEKDWHAELKALWNAVMDPNSPYYVRYQRDHRTIDQFAAPLKTMTKLHAGDCDDMSVVFASMATAAGYSARFRIVQAKGAPTWSHVYTMVGTPPGDESKVTQWYALDGAMREKGFGWEAPGSMLEHDSSGKPRRKDFRV